MAHPLDRYNLDVFKQRFATVVKVKLCLQRMFVYLFLHGLNLLNRAVGQHRQAGVGTPTSRLRAVKLHHVLPALLFSSDGQFSR